MPASQFTSARLLTLISMIFAVVVIVLGAFTRLSDAGLGCPDWPTCYGHLWVPGSADDIANANVNFPDTPVLEGKTWPEQIHRIVASTLGALCLILLASIAKHCPVKQWRTQVGILALLVVMTLLRAILGDALDPFLIGLVIIYFIRLFLIPDTSLGQHLKLSLFITGWVILQGLFGMWTVTLKLWPQVVTAHLFGGFTLLALLWWQFLNLNKFKNLTGPYPLSSAGLQLVFKMQKLAKIGLFVVVIQVLLGGWTSSNYAALACPDLPLCQGQIWPDPDFIQGFNILQDIGPNYLGGSMDNAARVAVHLSHRIGALLVSLLILVLALRLFQANYKKLAIILVANLAIQIALGISNVLFHLPLEIAVLHNAVGALLVMTLVTINYLLSFRTTL